MVPIYTIGSCLSFRLFWLAPYIDIVRDCYEAFVVYAFFVLLQNYFAGSFQEQVKRLKGKPKQKVLAPFCCFSINPSGQTFLVTVRLLCLQYVALRPTATIIAFILNYFHALCPLSGSPKHGQFWITAINFISSTVAVYGLFTFYFTIHNDIKEHQPLWKMIAVKFVIFFAFFQSIVLSLLNTAGVLKPIGQISAEDVSTLIQNFLVCFEMVVAAGIHLKAFGWREFVLRPVGSTDGRKGKGRVGGAEAKGGGELEYQLKTPVLLAMGDALSPHDFLHDIKEAPGIVRSNRRRRHAKESARRKQKGEGGGGGAEGRKKTRKSARISAAAGAIALGTAADAGGDEGVAAGPVAEKVPGGGDISGAMKEEEERIGGVEEGEFDSDYDSEYDSDYTTSSTYTTSGMSTGGETASLSSGLEVAGGSGLRASQSEERLIPK
ncbi:hypothetical protein HDV00_003370 [Rhizophlyctis rosea]|nr:hypothetical protein HDV00_003370 [Rhizophlyctis rosea]